MIRQVIKIDEEKCIGCSLCVNACHESAIQLIDGKAKLLRDDYCDGLGNCLPKCPTNAISFETREAVAYDKQAVKEHKAKLSANMARIDTALTHWPIQLKLAPTNAPFFNDVDLLIAADCCAYSYGSFHNDFMKDKAVIIGCPKLDMVDYTEKLTAIIKDNDLKSVTVTRMSVPCCGGIEYATKQAVKNSGKDVDCDIVTIDTNGVIL